MNNSRGGGCGESVARRRGRCCVDGLCREWDFIFLCGFFVQMCTAVVVCAGGVLSAPPYLSRRCSVRGVTRCVWTLWFWQAVISFAHGVCLCRKLCGTERWFDCEVDTCCSRAGACLWLHWTSAGVAVAEKQCCCVSHGCCLLHFRENSGSAMIFILARPPYDSFL